jgi:energy-coupling factor transporter ATP-binding protein EcfA2
LLKIDELLSLMAGQIHLGNFAKLTDAVSRNFLQVWTPDCDSGKSVLVHEHDVAAVRIVIDRVQHNDRSNEIQS